jgi:hypothetical protein
MVENSAIPIRSPRTKPRSCARRTLPKSTTRADETGQGLLYFYNPSSLRRELARRADAPLRPRRGQKPLPKNGLFSCEPPAPGRFLKQNLVGSPDYEPTSLVCRPSPLRHFLNLKCGSSFPRLEPFPLLFGEPRPYRTIRHRSRPDLHCGITGSGFRGCSFQPKYVPRTRGPVCLGVRASCLLVRGPFHLA